MPDIVSFGPFELIPAERRLMRMEDEIPVSSRALDLLILLTERPGEVVSHRELLARAWPSALVQDANLRVHIRGLRHALEDGRKGSRYVANVPGRGYCFVAPVERAPPSSPREADPPAAARGEEKTLEDGIRVRRQPPSGSAEAMRSAGPPGGREPDGRIRGAEA